MSSPRPPEGTLPFWSRLTRHRQHHSYLPLWFPRSRSPSPSSSSLPAVGSPPALYDFQPFTHSQWGHVLAVGHGLARRKLVQLVLTLALPVFAVLLITELHSQRVQYASLGAELAARDVAGMPDSTGHVSLAAWRARRAAKDENDPGELDIWPSWWGNADEVGPSPFDHIPPSGTGHKRRILFLTDYNDYLERMNTHTYEIVDAALRHENVIVDVWGPGWAGYDWDVPLSTNVKRRANRVASLEASLVEHQEMIRIGKEEKERQARERLARSWYQTLFGSSQDEEEEEPEDDAPPPFVQPPWTSFHEECSPAVRFDAVWTISDIYKPEHQHHLDALDCGALLVQQLGDCHEHRCLKEWYPYSNNITLSKYAFELPELFNYENVRTLYPGFEMGLFGHSPDTGNAWDFYPLPWGERTAKAVVFGYDGSLYPIRTTVTDRLWAIEADPSLPPSPISRHPHPGYTVDTPEKWRNHPLETYVPGHETYSTHRELRKDFARGMRTAQICLFDASVERKLIRKYAQALLSGCVIAADLPTEHEEAMSNFTIQLHPKWEIGRIEEELNKYLDDPQRLQQMALDGFAYARQHLSTTGKVSNVLRMVEAHNAGARGYDHAFSFSSRCRSYFGDAPPPPWCVGEESYRGLEDRV